MSPTATTHILAAVILIELFRDFFIKDNKKFPRYYILIAAIGAVIPDLDIAIYYILYFFGFTFNQVHRTFFHTIFIPLILFFAGIFAWTINFKISQIGKRHMKLPRVFYILAFGSFLHLILDSTIIGSISPFYPFSSYKIGLDIISYLPKEISPLIIPTIEGILLLFWLFWMEFKLKISNYF
ncbi:MAG: metal-dependent hydrolase [Nanoarchaeota archaeon]